MNGIKANAFRGAMAQSPFPPLAIYVLAAITILLTVTISPQEYYRFLYYYIFLIVIAVFLRIPVKYLFHRTLHFFPFIFLISLMALFTPRPQEGMMEILGLNLHRKSLLMMLSVISKSVISFTSVIIALRIADFNAVLILIRRWGLPTALLDALVIFHKYLFSISDEARRMKFALLSRGFRGKWLLDARQTGGLIAMLFIRSYERGERIYSAMQARLYDGKIVYSEPQEELRVQDIIICFFILSVLVILRVI